jgi:hypothetical protein
MATGANLVQLLHNVYVNPAVTLSQYSILRIVEAYHKENEDTGVMEFFYKLGHLDQIISIRCDEVRHLTFEEFRLYNEKFLLLDDVAARIIVGAENGTVLIKRGTIFHIDTFRPIGNTYYAITINSDNEIHYVAPLHKSILYSDVEIALNILKTNGIISTTI